MYRRKQKTRTGVWRARLGRTFCAFAAFFALTANADAEAVARIGDTDYGTLAAAIQAAEAGATVSLRADTIEDVTVGKSITLDLNGKKLTNMGSGNATVSIAEGATVTVKNGSIVGGAAYYNIEVKKGGTATFEDVTATAGNTGSSMIDNWGTLTIDSGSYTGGLNVVKSEEDSVLKITGGTFTLTDTKGSAYTAVILTYGDTTISGGEFIQSVKEPKKWARPIVVMTGLVDGYPAVTKVTGGTFKNNATESIFRGLGKATSANFEVSGGTFNKSIKDGYCAEGFIPTKNADGTYGVKKGTYVAAVVKSSGTVTGKYETLADALAKASTGTTVKLLAEAKENVTIAKDITFDLNGKTLNGGTEKGKPALTVTAKVTVKDSSEAKTGTIKREDTADNSGKGSHYVIDIQDDGWLTFESGSVTNGSGAGGTKGASLVRVGNDGKAKDPGLTVKGGTFTQDNFIAIKVDRGTLLMEGGTVNSAHSYAIENWWNATLSGGTVNGAVASWTYSGGADSTLKITGGTINGDVTAVNYDDAEGKKATVEIGGGTVNGKLDTRRYDSATGTLTSIKDPAKATIAARGGTFSTAVDEAYCAAGFIPTKNDDNTYGVKQGAYVAAIGDSAGTVTAKYETLSAAIESATAGETVTLFADTKENVTIAKDITFDLNGKTLNGGTEKGKPALTVTAKVTVKDSSEAKTGTIKREDTADNSGKGSHYVIDIQDDGWLTFESGSVTNGSGAGGTKGASLVRVGNDGKAKDPGLTVKGGTFTQDNFIAIKVDRGTLLMEGGTVNSAHSYAIENWWNATLSGGTVNGAVASWTYSGGADSTLKITGGTINGDVTAVNYDDAEGKKATVEIGGGTVNGKLDTRRYDPATGELTSIEDPAKATIGVTGGTFSTAVDEAYCAEGYAPKKIDDKTYGVESIVVSIEVSVGDGKKVALPFLKTWLRTNIGETETQWTAANLEAQAANGWAKWVDGVLGLSTTAAQAGAAVAEQGMAEAIPVSLAHVDADSALLKADALKIAYVLSGSSDRKIWTKVAEEADKVKLAIPLNTETLYKYYRVDVEIVAAE